MREESAVTRARHLFEKGNEAAGESLKQRLRKALILCDAKAQCDKIVHKYQNTRPLHGLSTAPPPVHLDSEFPWRNMQSEFTISGVEQDVELIIEIRAFKGMVWAARCNLELVAD